MAKHNSHRDIAPSVLDRLLGAPREYDLNDERRAVGRDLQYLLNTRRRCRSWPVDLSELDTSLVSYGIPDVSGANLGSAGNREEFRRVIEQAISRFEPRFHQVRVALADTAEGAGSAPDRILKFRIDALLRARPAPEEVAFDTAIEPATTTVEVKG